MTSALTAELGHGNSFQVKGHSEYAEAFSSGFINTLWFLKCGLWSEEAVLHGSTTAEVQTGVSAECGELQTERDSDVATGGPNKYPP